MATDSTTIGKSFDLWPICVAAYLAVMLFTGGISVVETPIVYLHLALAIAISFVAIFRLYKFDFPTRLSFFAMIIVLAALALVCAQLIPLPPAIWGQLQGHDILTRNAELLHQEAGWAPMTLSPERTRECALALLSPTAGFLAALTVKASRMMPIIVAVLFCAIASILLALLQTYHAGDGSYYLYEADSAGTGLFNNRNFFAAQIYCSLPFVGLAVYLTSRGRDISIGAAGLFGVVYSGIALAGIAVSASRAGTVLAMVALVFAIVLARSGRLSSRLRIVFLGLGAMVLGLLVLGQASMVGILRFAEPSFGLDHRWSIWLTSVEVLKKYFVLGSGFGTFPSVYEFSEGPEFLQQAYINHVHNDWMELAIEGGFPAVLLMVTGLVWYFAAVTKAWIGGYGSVSMSVQRTATVVIALLMAHAVFDFPLRTPALLTLFGICCGICCLAPQKLALKMRTGIRHVVDDHPPPEHKRRRPFAKRSPSTLQ